MRHDGHLHAARLLAFRIGGQIDVIVLAIFGHQRHGRHHNHVVELLGHYRDLGSHTRLKATVGCFDEDVDVKGHAAAATGAGVRVCHRGDSRDGALAHDIGKRGIGHVGALAHGNFGDILFAHLNRHLHLGQVGDLHALLAAARVAFTHDHAACYRSAHLGVELHDAARAGGLYGALGRLCSCLFQRCLSRGEVALGGRDGICVGVCVRWTGRSVTVRCRCGLCGRECHLCIVQVFLGGRDRALRLGNSAIERVVLNGHEYVALVDALSGLHVDLFNRTVDRRGDDRCRDGLKLPLGFDCGGKRAFGDHVGHRSVGACGLRVDDQRCDDGNERDGNNDTDGDTASDELFAPTLGTLCLKLFIGFFIGDIGRIVETRLGLLGVCSADNRQGLGGILGHAIGIVRTRIDRGDLGHSVSFIDMAPISIYARRDRRAYRSCG